MQRLWKALALLCVLGLVGAGTAGAARLITGAQVRNGSLTGADIRQDSLSAERSELRRPGVAPGRHRAAPVPPVPPGPSGPAGSADRYAELNAAGFLTGPRQAASSRRRSTIRPAPAIYCLTFTGDSRPKAGAATGAESDTFATLQIDPAGFPDCPPQATVRVETFDLSLATAQANGFRLILEDD